MKKLLLSLMLFPIAVFAQIKFEPGYFIDNNGTKTECLIKNVAWKNSPTSFDYKLSENDTEKQQQITHVSAFETGGYKFERYTVQIERSLTNVGYMDTKPAPDYTTETLFLKVIVEGKTTLYGYEDGNVRKFFYKTGTDNVPQLLLFKQYEEEQMVKENKRYQYQLAFLFADAKLPQSAFARVKYSEESLKDFFIKNSGVEGTEAAVDKTVHQNKSKFMLRVTAGAAMSSLKMESSLGTYPDNYDFDAKAVFNVGGEAEMVLPFNNNKWSVFISPYFTSYKNDGTNMPAQGSQVPQHWSAEFKSISIPVGFRYYMFLNQSSKVFINVAYAINVNIGDGKLQKNTTVYDLSNRLNWLAGAGYSYKRINAELRYTFNRDLINYAYRSALYSSYGLVLSYQIL
ncbi:outer membrane beta-barrel protein [Flavobacterium sp. RHBU_3]|uniref:outer membrane beta-barrel protein n=1 Tax=Flavobacterium sp. RHBU_3 TaxID=3391184 RepID=UPI003984EBF0